MDFGSTMDWFTFVMALGWIALIIIGRYFISGWRIDLFVR